MHEYHENHVKLLKKLLFVILKTEYITDELLVGIAETLKYYRVNVGILGQQFVVRTITVNTMKNY